MPEPSALTSDSRAMTHRLGEAGRADMRFAGEFERIGKGGIQAAPQHADRLQSGDGAHHQPAVGDRQVLALQKHDAEIAGDIGVLVIGFVERAGGEDGDPAGRLGAWPSARRESGGRSRRAGGHASRHRCPTARASWRRGFPAQSPRRTPPACGRPAPTIRRSGPRPSSKAQKCRKCPPAGFTPAKGRRYSGLEAIRPAGSRPSLDKLVLAVDVGADRLEQFGALHQARADACHSASSTSSGTCASGHSRSLAPARS